MSNAEREIAFESMDQAIGRRVHQLMWDRKITAGYIRLSVPGSAEVKGAGSLTTNKNYQIQQDPNAIQFSRAKLNDEFEAVADAINRALLGA